MTLRAWLLLFAAAIAGVAAALLWPEGGPEPPLRVPDRTLIDGDVDTFLRICDQLAADRDAVRVSLPHGRPMLQFAAEMSQQASQLRGTAERSGLGVADLLAIVVALGQAERVETALAAHRRAAEARERDAELSAEVFESHGRAAPREPEPEAPPPWWAGLSERERANHAVWARRGAEAAERWAALMLAPAAG